MESIATTIWKQIPVMTKMACGAREPMADGNSLIFKVLNKQRKVVITLTSMDDYTCKLIAWDNNHNVKTLEEHDGIYCDILGETIYHMCNK